MSQVCLKKSFLLLVLYSQKKGIILLRNNQTVFLPIIRIFQFYINESTTNYTFYEVEFFTSASFITSFALPNHNNRVNISW